MERKPEPELMDLPEEARAYAAADFADVNEAFVKRLLELAPQSGVVRALDLGAGPADITIRVAQARPQWPITAVDGADAMIEIAREAVGSAKMEKRITLCCADAKATPLPDRSFNLIFSNSLLHHMPDPLPLWREIRRLAAPGALIFVRDLMRPSSDVTARRVVELYAASESKLLQDEFYRSLLAAFRPDQVRDQLDAVGLSSLEVQPVTDRHLDVFGRL